MDEMLTVEEVADILKVKPLTVRQMFREGRLRAFKIGKSWRTTRTWLEQDLDAMSRGETVPATPPSEQPSGRSVRRTGSGRKSRSARVRSESESSAATTPATTDPDSDRENGVYSGPLPASAMDPMETRIKPDVADSVVVGKPQADGPPSEDSTRMAEEILPQEADPQQYLF